MKAASCKVWYLESVHLTLTDVYTDNRGDMRISLISPSNTRSLVLNTRYKDHHKGTTDLPHLQTNAFWGENPGGVWTVRIDNMGKGRIRADRVQVELSGTYDNPHPTEYTSVTRFNCRFLCNVKHKLARERCMLCKRNLRLATAHLEHGDYSGL